MRDARAAAESVYKEEAGRIIATLIRLSGSFDLAEEAFRRRSRPRWRRGPNAAFPDQPGSLDHFSCAAQVDRRRPARSDATKQGQCARSPHRDPGSEYRHLQFRRRLKWSTRTIACDSIFTCCHPALAVERSSGADLRTSGGLATAEIARAFHCAGADAGTEAGARQSVRSRTLASLTRCRRADRIPERLAAVQAVLYLIFNEGYSATSGDQLVRRELATEAIRLGAAFVQVDAE